MKTKQNITIIGGGLAGSEAAYQAARRGYQVTLYEMRPIRSTGAHTTAYLSELICSNSFGSKAIEKASGLLQEELRLLGSFLLDCAEKTAVPAGGALAVDRHAFAQLVTEILTDQMGIQIIRQEVTEIPEELAIIATGPLTSPELSMSLKRMTGKDNLFFFDAISPIVNKESIDMDIAYRASRYGRGENSEGDYINCPMTEEEYHLFVDALIQAQRIELKEFELSLDSGVDAGKHKFFEGCLPIEVLARRGQQSLAFGPMRPTGLRNPNTNKRPYAVVQLRQDNLADSLYNIVGFQTNLAFPEQKRVFRLIPGLENAEFARFGQMHRNTYIFSPELINPTMQCRIRENLFFAGQITGIEGYMGNIASGLVAGINAVHLIKGEELAFFPKTTMIGALCNYVTHASLQDFQPMKANFGLLQTSDIENQAENTNKKSRKNNLIDRSLQDLKEFIIKENLTTTLSLL